MNIHAKGWKDGEALRCGCSARHFWRIFCGTEFWRADPAEIALVLDTRGRASIPAAVIDALVAYADDVAATGEDLRQYAVGLVASASRSRILF